MSFEKRKPDFVAKEGVSIWTNQDKNNNSYQTVHIPLLDIKVNCFATFETKTETSEEIKEEKVYSEEEVKELLKGLKKP